MKKKRGFVEDREAKRRGPAGSAGRGDLLLLNRRASYRSYEGRGGEGRKGGAPVEEGGSDISLVISRSEERGKVSLKEVRKSGRS